MFMLDSQMPPAPEGQGEMSDAEAFGTPPAAPAAPVVAPAADPGEMSDAEAFGTPAAPQGAPAPPSTTADAPGVLSQIFDQGIARPARAVGRGIEAGNAGIWDLLAKAATVAGKVGDLTSVDTPAGKLSPILPTSDQTGSIADYLKARSAEAAPAPLTPDQQKAQGLGDKLYEGVGEAPAQIAEYVTGGKALKSASLGMAAVDALRASDQGPVEAIKQGVKGMVMGKLMEGLEPFTRTVKALVLGTAGGVDAAAQGGDAKDVAAGAITLGGMGAMEGGHVGAREAALDWLSRKTGKPTNEIGAADVEAHAPEMAQDPQLRAVLDANGVTDPTDPRVAQAADRLASRGPATAPPEPGTLDGGAPVQRDMRQPAARAGAQLDSQIEAQRRDRETVTDQIEQQVAAGLESGAIKPEDRDAEIARRVQARLGAPERQAPGVIVPQAAPDAGTQAGVELRGKFNAPVPVEPQPTRLSPSEVAHGRAVLNADGQPATGEAPNLAGSEDRLPQTSSDQQGQREAGDAFALAQRQRDRAAAGVADTQTAGRPEGRGQQSVFLDEGQPVEILKREMIPDPQGNVHDIATVRRYDPRTGAPEDGAIEYQVRTKTLKSKLYAPEPRRAQDFVEQSNSPAGDKLGLPEQTYRTTEADPNTEFPGAGDGRTPFPQQPEGSGPDRPYSTAEEAARAFEDRRAAGDTGPQFDDAAQQRYQQAKASNTPKGQDRDGAWVTDENGFVTSDKGGPVRFADHKQAARWIIKEGQAKSKAGQFFEIENHPSGKGYSVRERGRTGPEETPPSGSNGERSDSQPNAAGDRPERQDGSRQYGEQRLQGPEASGAAAPENAQGRGEASSGGGVRTAPSGGDAVSGRNAGTTTDHIIDAINDSRVAPRKADVAAHFGIPEDQAQAMLASVTRRPDSPIEAVMPPRSAGYDPARANFRRVGDPTRVDRRMRDTNAWAYRETGIAPEDYPSYGAFLDAVGERMSQDKAARVAAEQDSAAEADFAAAEKAAQEWVASRGEAWEPDTFYEGAPRTLEDLESESQQAAQRHDSGQPGGEAERHQSGSESAAPGGAGARGDSEQPGPPAGRASDVSARDRQGDASEPGGRPVDGGRGVEDQGRSQEAPRKGVTLGALGSPDDVARVISDAAKLPAKAARVIADDLTASARDIRAGIEGLASGAAGIPNAFKYFAYSNEGRLRGMERLMARKGSAIGSNAIGRIADMFHQRPGTESSAVNGGFDYHTRIDQRTASNLNRLHRTLEPIADKKGQITEAQSKQLRALLTSTRPIDASTPMGKAAAGLRALLDREIEYRRAVDPEIGKVDRGYFPRTVDAERVRSDPSGFVRAAEKLYRGIGSNDARGEAEAWRDRILAGDLSRGMPTDAMGVARTSAKAREFGPRADETLKDFYHNDVTDTLQGYFAGSARATEFARLKPDLRKALDDLDGELAKMPRAERPLIRDQIDQIVSSNIGTYGAGTTQAMRRTSSFLQGLTFLGALKRHAFTGAVEPFMIPFRAGITAKSVGAIANGFGEAVRYAWTKGKGDTRYHRVLAELAGAVNDPTQHAMMNKVFGIEGSDKLNQLSTRFMHASLMEQLMVGKRIAGTKLARGYLLDNALDLDKPGAAGKRADFYLKELGIQDPAGFKKWLVDTHSGDVPLSKLMGNDADAQRYLLAVNRFVGQIAMKPNAAVKPIGASHPIARLMYTFQAYNYAFMNNVIKRQARVMARDPVQIASTVAWMVPFLAAASASEYLRGFFYGDEGKQARANQTWGETAVRVLDRTGLLGVLSPYINAVHAIKYRRGFSETLIGAPIGRQLDAATKIAGLTNASPRTDTAERNTAYGIYDMFIDPVVTTALMSAPGGNVARGVGMAYGGERIRDAFADHFGGPKKGAGLAPSQPSGPSKPYKPK